jgi:hypothetical protein
MCAFDETLRGTADEETAHPLQLRANSRIERVELLSFGFHANALTYLGGHHIMRAASRTENVMSPDIFARVARRRVRLFKPNPSCQLNASVSVKHNRGYNPVE